MSQCRNLLLLAAFLVLSQSHCEAQQTAGSDQPGARKPASSQPANDSDRVRMISATLSNQIPLIIGHRGAAGYLPEHTTEATAFAHALGADFIHQQVVLSKDGIAMVLHSQTFQQSTNVANAFPDRHTGGSFSPFDFTRSELQSLQISQHVTQNEKNDKHVADTDSQLPPGQSGFRIATLEEHLQLIAGLNRSRNRKVGMVVEIQRPAEHRARGLDVAGEVLRLLQKFGHTEADAAAFVQCRDAAEIRRMRVELKCRLPLIQLLDEPVTASELAEHSTVADGICVPLHALIADSHRPAPQITDLVQTAHRHALLVYVRTFQADRLPQYADSPNALLDLLVRKSGVDGIFADQPDVVLAWRQAAMKSGPIRGPFHLLNNGSNPP